MDRENFDAIITRYLEKFDYTNGEKPEEYFKWSAIARFQKNWNLESDDLYDTFSRAIAKTSVLLDGGHSAPSSGIKALLKIPDEVEYVREALLIALIVIGVELAVHLALIGVVIYARHSLIKKTGNTTPHIIILLSGIFSFNLFYLIGGILGIVAANNDSEDE